MNFDDATIIAICALVLTVGQMWTNRRHNRLSVRPHLDSHIRRIWSDQGFTVSLAVRNVGIGPCITKDVRVFKDGARFMETAGHAVLIEALVDACIQRKLNYRLSNHGLPGIGCGIKAAEEHCIAEILFINLPRNVQHEVEALFNGVRIEIDYESFYGERWTFTTEGEPIAKAPEGAKSSVI